MAKAENQKFKSICVARILEKYSDEDHPMTAQDIINRLYEEYEIHAERRSIQRDINMLIALGYDIEEEATEGKATTYRIISRQVEYDDIRLIAETLYSANFLSRKKSEELVATLCEFCSTYQAKKIKDQVHLHKRNKTKQRGTQQILMTINEAIEKNSKISFKYLEYNIHNVVSRVECNNGELFQVSPYYLVLDNGYYYLLGARDKGIECGGYIMGGAGKDIECYAATFRVDRMKNVRFLGIPRDIGFLAYYSDPKQFNIETYPVEATNMAGCLRSDISIKFSNYYFDTVLEKFGTGANTFYTPTGEHSFIVKTSTIISTQFYGWLCGFGINAEILSPPDIVEEFKNYVEMICSCYQPKQDIEQDIDQLFEEVDRKQQRFLQAEKDMTSYLSELFNTELNSEQTEEIVSLLNSDRSTEDVISLIRKYKQE